GQPVKTVRASPTAPAFLAMAAVAAHGPVEGPWACRQSANDDLHPPVLGFAHIWTGWHQQVRLTESLNADRILRDAIPHQLRCHRAGTAHRETLVVLRRAGRVGIAVHLDPR